MVAEPAPRSLDRLSSLDELLAEEGKLEVFEAVAIKEVLAWQIEPAMKEQKVSRKRLAERMGTSRSQGRTIARSEGRKRDVDHVAACSRDRRPQVRLELV